MKEYLQRFIRLSFIFITAMILQSCGGSSDKSPSYSISASTSEIHFANEFLQVSDDTYKVDITFEGNGLLVGFAPDSQPAAWLNYRTENVTANSATLYIDVINAENIVNNLYETTLRISTGDVDKINLVHHDINVSLLVWQLITDKSLISYRATLGEPSIPAQTLSITSENNEWAISSDVSWLSFDTESGTGDATITVTPDISTFEQAQLYQGNITLTETTTGDSKVIPVEVGLDQHYLFSNQSTISLAKLANISALSKTVMIQSNSPSDVQWQATTNVDWLTLTRTMDTNELTVAINPSATFTNAQNDAVITINAVDADNNINEDVIPESIKLSYYQSGTESKTVTIEDIDVNSNALINSTYLPLTYLGVGNQLNVYHQYTGELIDTIDVAPADTLLENFVIHPDGALLLAKAIETVTNEDETTSEITHWYQINLTDYTVSELSDVTIEYDPIRYVSFSGRHFIVTQTLEYANDNLKRLFWDTDDLYFTRNVDQASMSEAVYALDLTDSSFKRYMATVNDFTNEKIVVSQSMQYRPESLGEGQAVTDFVVADDESGIYAISPTTEWISFDGETFVDNGLLTQSENSQALALVKSHNNRAHYVRFDPLSGFIVDIYNSNQALINTVLTQGQQPSSVKLSQDDKRLVINASNNNQVEIINIDQFSSSVEQLSFATTFGDSTITSQELTLSGLSENWQITSNNDWLIVSSATDGDIHTVTATIDTDSISTWGLLTGSITVTDDNSNTSRIITVTIAVDEVRLFSNYPALAFNQQFDRSVLSHTVNILTNKESAVSWQAQANVDWITLTPDVINNTLTVTVDPAKVTTNGIHLGTITLSPQNNGESVDGLIDVSFSKGDFDTSDLSELTIDNVIPNTSGVVLDPLRPYIYVAQGDSIEVFNIIDGTKVTTITSLLAGFDLTNLIIHPDGSLLLVSNEETYQDENGQEATRINYYQVDLAQFSMSQINSDDVDIVYAPENVVMIDGKAIVVTQTLEYANLSLQQQYWDSTNLFITPFVTDVKDNNTVIAFNGATQNLVHKTLNYNAFADNSITLTDSVDYISPVFANTTTNVLTNSGGSNIYSVNTTNEWSTFDGTTFTDQGLLDGNPFTSPVEIAVDSADNVYTYRFDFTIGFFTLTKYDDNQTSVWATGYTAGSVDVYLAPDYHRVVHINSDENKMVIDYMPN